jgi:hypothetical protein
MSLRMDEMQPLDDISLKMDEIQPGVDKMVAIG